MDGYTKQLKKILKKNGCYLVRNGFIKMPVPPKFGRKVEIIILPTPYKQYESESSEYFECVGENGTEYKLHDWTDEDFNRFSRTSACKDDDTVAEDILDV